MGPSLQLSTCMPHNQLSYHIDNIVLPTTQLAAVTLTSDPLTLKLVHGVLLSQGPFLPSLVFVGLFVFPLGGGTGQTDGQHQHMMGPPSRKNGPIINQPVDQSSNQSFKTRTITLIILSDCNRVQISEARQSLFKTFT